MHSIGSICNLRHIIVFPSNFFLLEELRHILCINGDHMVRENILCQVKPEFGHLGQNSTFGGNLIVKDHVKTADTVSGNYNKAVPLS